MTALLVAGGLLAVALLVVFAVALTEQIGHHRGARRAHRDYLADERRANHGPPPGMPNRRRRDDGPGGRHRRTTADTCGAHTATGILRAVRADADALPPIPRATRAQLRDPRR